LVATACGVPSSGKPIVDAAASAKDSSGGSGGVVSPPNPSQFPVNDPASAAAFVENGYLSAVAGQVGSKAQHLAATAFMTTDAGSGWKPEQQVTVIRIISRFTTQQAHGYEVNEVVEVVGTFDPQAGSLNASPVPSKTTLDFTIMTTAGSEKLTKVPPGMFMTDDALHNSAYYTPHVIYFWDDSHGLIPDLRYLPAAMSTKQQATAVVTWILDGPPAWMAGVATQPAPGVSLDDNTIPADGDTFVVNLNSAARALSPADQANLLAQIRWSLGDIHPGGRSFGASPVQLQIPNQPKRTDSDSAYTDKNQAWNRAPNPTAYAIDGGKVRPLNLINDTQVPILNSKTNANVLLAAVDPSQTLAAFVRPSAGGKQELWIRRTTKGAFEPIKGASSFSRPVWLVQPAGELAIVADGQFYLIDAKNKATEIPVPTIGGSISGFSIASDGRQVAFVANGQLWTSLLDPGNQPSLSSPRLRNVKPALDTVTAVAWSAVDQLVVAGAVNGDASVIETYVDGSYGSKKAAELKSYGNTTISKIVSYPPNPQTSDEGSIFVMVQTSGFACSGRAQCETLQWVPVATSGPQPTSPFYQD
jgi:hypothetical protein